MARHLHIVKRRLSKQTAIASPNDFKTRACGEANFSDLLRSDAAHVSPYCVDLAKGELYFVRTPARTDLQKAHPFYYQAQREHASDLYALSFREAEDLAEALVDDAVGHTRFLYSPGRCGSTVVGKMASALPGVQAVSEPDIYSQITLARDPSDPLLEARLTKLAATTTSLLTHHLRVRSPGRPVVLVKHRGITLYSADLLKRAAPEARSLFLTRNVSDVVNSYCGAFLRSRAIGAARRLGLDQVAVRWLRRWWSRTRPEVGRFMPLVLEPALPDRHRHGVVELLTLGWMAMLDQAAWLHESGTSRFTAVLRYEDLEESPEAFVHALSLALGVNLGSRASARVDEALGAAGADSQKGSTVESDGRSRLTTSDRVRIHRLLDQLGWLHRPAMEVA